MIELKGVSKMQKCGRILTAVLSNVDLTFQDTGFYCVMGRNRSGKTSLLDMISTIDKPDAGDILFDGKSILHFSEKEKDEYKLENISYISRTDLIIQNLSVYDNCFLSVKHNGKDKFEARRRTFCAIDAVGLAGKEDLPAIELSNYERKRLALAMAAVKGARVILVDEPTEKLDASFAREFMSILQAMSKTACVIAVTADENVVNTYSDIIVSLNYGTLSSVKKNENPDRFETSRKNVIPDLKEFRDPDRNVMPWLRIGALPKMYLAQIKSGIYVLVALTLLYSILFAAFITMNRTADYDLSESVIKSLKDNDIYFLNIRSSVTSSAMSKETVDGIINASCPNAVTGDVYAFSTSLEGFGDAVQPAGTEYEDAMFTSYVRTNFAGCKFDLFYGEIPSEQNEVLISYYMAEKMLASGLYDVRTVYGFVGHELQDKTTGLKIVISGIYESDPKSNFLFEGENVSAEKIAVLDEYRTYMYGTIFGCSIPVGSDGNTAGEYDGAALMLSGNVSSDSKKLDCFLTDGSSGLCVDSAYEKAIRELDQNRSQIGSICNFYSIVLGLFVALFVIANCLVSARANTNKISILYAWGYSSFGLSWASGLFGLVCAALMTGLGTGIAAIFVSRSNAILSYDYGPYVTTMFVDLKTVLITMAIPSVIIVIAATAYYFIMTFCRTKLLLRRFNLW